LAESIFVITAILLKQTVAVQDGFSPYLLVFSAPGIKELPPVMHFFALRSRWSNNFRHWLLLVWVCGLAAQLAWIPAANGQPAPAPPLVRERLGPPPLNPPRPAGAEVTPASAATFVGPFLDINRRETSRQFYNLVHQASVNVPLLWSGTYDGSGDPGTNSSTYLDAVQRRVNYFRAMAGVPSGIVFDATLNDKCQAAALMMGGNTNLSHLPPISWLYYTIEGAEAAGKSNLSLGHAGPEAITSQMEDSQIGNYVVGHRRWILYPQTRTMGTGNVPESDGRYAANTLWVIDIDHFWDTRPAVRDDIVAWPPPGFVPYQVVYPRWSFSHHQISNLENAKVFMTSNGVPLAVRMETPVNNYGENTLAWVPGGLDPNAYPTATPFPRPMSDTVYEVTISNLVFSGVATPSYSYSVTVFDAAQPGLDYVPVTLSGTDTPFVNATNVYTFSTVDNASSYEWGRSSLDALAFTDGAENGLGNWIVNAATDLYSLCQDGVKYAESNAFHLAHPEPSSQVLTLGKWLLATTNSSVRFQSRLGYAATNQVAKVQLSTTGGALWTDLFVEPGTASAGQADFELVSVPLEDYAGRRVQLRLNYEYQSGNYYPQTYSGVGWYVDDFTLVNCYELGAPEVSATATTNTFGFAPTDLGHYALEVRPVWFGDYAGEWGEVLPVITVPNTNVVVRINSLRSLSPNSCQIDFTLLQGNPAGYEVWSAAEVNGPFAKEAGASIQTLVPGSDYRAVVVPASQQRFYRIRAL
jgi:hypothetical protein